MSNYPKLNQVYVPVTTVINVQRLQPSREFFRCNFSQVNLAGMDLKGVNLRTADLQGAKLKGADLRGAVLEWADLRGANLKGANFLFSNFIKTTIGYCQISHQRPPWNSNVASIIKVPKYFT